MLFLSYILTPFSKDRSEGGSQLLAAAVEDIKQRLTDDLMTTCWEGLAAHCKKDHLLLVSKELDIIDVAMRVAQDSVPHIEKWMVNEEIRKPSLNQITTWENSPELEFDFLIVQPWVLIQEKTH